MGTVSGTQSRWVWGGMGVFVEVRWRVARWGWVVDGGGNPVASLVPSSTAGYRPALLPGCDSVGGRPRVGLRGAGLPWALGRNPVGIGGHLPHHGGHGWKAMAFVRVN